MGGKTCYTYKCYWSFTTTTKLLSTTAIFYFSSKNFG